MIHLLTKEGSAPIYHEFYKILERTYPKLDVLQELHVMQAWLYINPDKRKPFELVGHFVNGWLRRSAQAKIKRGSTPVLKKKRGPKQTRAAQQTKSGKTQKAANSRATAKLKKAIQATKPMEPQQPMPVTQALTEFKTNSKTKSKTSNRVSTANKRDEIKIE